MTSTVHRALLALYVPGSAKDGRTAYRRLELTITEVTLPPEFRGEVPKVKKTGVLRAHVFNSTLIAKTTEHLPVAERLLEMFNQRLDELGRRVAKDDKTSADLQALPAGLFEGDSLQKGWEPLMGKYIGPLFDGVFKRAALTQLLPDGARPELTLTPMAEDLKMTATVKMEVKVASAFEDEIPF